jgi:hypothetical protein
MNSQLLSLSVKIFILQKVTNTQYTLSKFRTPKNGAFSFCEALGLLSFSVSAHSLKEELAGTIASSITVRRGQALALLDSNPSRRGLGGGA